MLVGHEVVDNTNLINTSIILPSAHMFMILGPFRTVITTFFMANSVKIDAIDFTVSISTMLALGPTPLTCILQIVAPGGKIVSYAKIPASWSPSLLIVILRGPDVLPNTQTV